MWLVVSWAPAVAKWQTSICSSPSPREWQIFFFFFNNFIFGCFGSSLLHRLFSSCGKRGLLSDGYAWAPYFGASLVTGHGIYSMQASAVVVPGLLSTGSAVVVQGLSCSPACGTDQGPYPCILHQQTHSLPLSHQGSPEDDNSWRNLIDSLNLQLASPAKLCWFFSLPAYYTFSLHHGFSGPWVEDESEWSRRSSHCPMSMTTTGMEDKVQSCWDFPGGPKAKTLCSQCRESRLDPWSGN